MTYETTNIAIIGDLHYCSEIGSRLDNIPQTCMDKIQDIAKECNILIFLGDVFERASMPFTDLVPFYLFLKKLKDSGKRLITILGNHDIYNEREDSLYSTSLGWLYITGIMEIILPDKPMKLQLGHTQLCFHTTYVRYKKALQHLPTIQLQSDCDNILLLHHLFEEYPIINGIPIDYINPSFKAVFLGHEHNPFGYKEINGIKFFRSGSLLRNKADSYNLDRIPYCFMVSCSPQGRNIFAYTSEVAKPGSEIFTTEAYNQKNLKKKILIKSIDEIVDRYKYKITDDSKFFIKPVLVELGIDEWSLSYLAEKYNKVGAVFE